VGTEGEWGGWGRGGVLYGVKGFSSHQETKEKRKDNQGGKDKWVVLVVI